MCARPQSACICRWTTPTAQPTELLILQHPLEVQHAKNTAGLLHRSLAHSRLLVGETWSAEALQAACPQDKYTVLLYPATAYPDHLAPTALEPQRLADPSAVRLIVLDATWRKSRKMLHQSPFLQGLPRYSLGEAQGQALVSAYSIRRAHRPGQCSTLEASCAALAQLQGDAARYRPLLQAFAGFVAQQAGYVPQPPQPQPGAL